MALFYQTKADDGEDVYLNADMVVAYKRSGKNTIAICFGAVALTIQEPLEKIVSDIELMEADDE